MQGGSVISKNEIFVIPYMLVMFITDNASETTTK